MKYDFTTVMNREHMDAKAVELIKIPNAAIDPGFDRIPMWIADMNFPTAPTVPKAIIARAEQPHYGYFLPREEYYTSVIRWHELRYGVKGLTKQNIGYENSVLGGMNTALSVLCSKGDSVLLQSPTYIGFTAAIENNGYHIALSELVKDENNIWRMDFADMEQKIIENKIHAAVFCTPHNPTGRVWERWELEQAMALFQKYDVTVISDEIWADIILKGHKHIPLQSVSADARQRTIALYAPSKTFNLAGLIGSYHVVYNRLLSDRIEKEASLSHYNGMNVLSMHALLGAYCPEGAEWTDELCQTLTGNMDFACDFIQKNWQGVRFSKPQGTYMLFLDCTDWCRQKGVSFEELLRAGVRVGVIWQDGRRFHGENCIRMNLALPLSRVEQAFRRLDQYVFNA